MRKLEGEQHLMRIFLGEREKYAGKPLYKVILQKLREEEFAGATVLRGISGFGAHSVYHTENIIRLSRDLPVIIEVVDSIDKIESILPWMEEVVDEGLVTIEKARVIRYKHKHEDS